MRKAYLAISYANRKLFHTEVAALKTLCELNDIELLVFVDKYNFRPDQEQEMMRTAFNEIDQVDFFIAELTTKSIGVGIELGYAYAHQKPIIYLRKQHAEYSTTAAGSANYILEYKNEEDLTNAMQQVIQQL